MQEHLDEAAVSKASLDAPALATSASSHIHGSTSSPSKHVRDDGGVFAPLSVTASPSAPQPEMPSTHSAVKSRQEILNRRHSAGPLPQPILSKSSSGRTPASHLHDHFDISATYPSFGRHTGLSTSHQAVLPRSSPSLSRGKRTSRQTRVGMDRTMDSAPIKKPRTGSSPPRRPDLSAFRPRSHHDGLIPSPWSPGGPRIVHRPSSSSTSDLAATMISRGREDLVSGGNITTLKLPRASITSPSPARSDGTPGSITSSVDICPPSLSPDSLHVLPPALHVLNGMGVIELYEQDYRPTFMVDMLSPASADSSRLNILYHNASLRGSQGLLHLLDNGDSVSDVEFAHFKTWVMGVNDTKGSMALPYHVYGGITWTNVIMRRRYRFVSATMDNTNTRATSPMPVLGDNTLADEMATANSSALASPTAEAVDSSDYFGEAAAKLSAMEGVESITGISPGGDPQLEQTDEPINQILLQGQSLRSTFDWTRLPLDDSLPEHIKFAKELDWSKTPLGPMNEWSYDLRAMSNLVMGTPHPAALYWGPDFVAIYNAAYLDLAGQKHPTLMGMQYKDAWPEIWDNVMPVFTSAWESGQATMKHDDQLFIRRHGYLEETFFSWSVIPLIGGDGEVTGLYNPAFEHTRRRVNERRMLTLREIGERVASATSVGEFWPQFLKGLDYNEYDIPFSLIYSTADEPESETASLQSGSLINCPIVSLEGSSGVPSGHMAALPTMDLRVSDDGFAPFMRQSLSMGGVPVVLSAADETLPTHLLDGLQWRGFGDPCTTIVVFPVVPTTTRESVTGFIVLGVNPRRPYDDDYKLFIHLLSRQLDTSMASVVLFEEEIRRGQRAARLAALDRQELSMQLLLRTQEANESEYKFTRMAEFAPVGMFIADPDGHFNYCNDMWWQISRHSRSADDDTPWMDSVRPEDRKGLEAAWRTLVDEKVTISVEFRFKYSQQSGENTIDTWVLMSAFPDKTRDGQLKSIFGCITDISSQKWAEKVQNERREEAVELKRQQENFIDITSHEMRNPLSAVLQSADQIISSITSLTAKESSESVDGKLLNDCLEAANIINLCASHQKKIVDDILTLSKLDSSLLVVTPVNEQPVKVVERALRMFEPELTAHDIEFEFDVDASVQQYGIEWARLDPSRLRQVLINLMSNAIKFTQAREERRIKVTLSASRDVSDVTGKGVDYFEHVDNPRTASLDINNEQEWGRGDLVNLHFSVEDTGPGLEEEELKLLFQRFHQATPRTHVQYGGSGLGLFISRILTEMQGGQIGVKSIKGVGSKFDFYIQCRKLEKPPKDFERVSSFKIGGRKVNSPSVTAAPSLPPSSPAQAGTSPLFDVLIVEDNLVNQKVLQRMLARCGNNTFVANHGMEALQTLQQSRFWAGKESEGVDISVILMDLEMPVMDGMTCARRIRELEREGTIVKHVPIIAVTAYARPEQIANAKAAGIDDVVLKPFRAPELLPKIEELVTKYNDLSLSAGA